MGNVEVAGILQNKKLRRVTHHLPPKINDGDYAERAHFFESEPEQTNAARRRLSGPAVASPACGRACTRWLPAAILPFFTPPSHPSF